MTTARFRLLLIEDQNDLAANIIDYLEGLGHTVDYAADGVLGLSLALSEPFDVVILDLMLPKMNGWEVCAGIREGAKRHVPVLMLTARDSLPDKLKGFDCGADDYMTKPFALAELLARCHALARRRDLNRGNEIVIGSLRVDLQRREALRGGSRLALTKKGFEILCALAEAYPSPVTRSELIERIWGEHWPDTDALRSHIYTLRQELDGPHRLAMLKTLHGVGFRLEADT